MGFDLEVQSQTFLYFWDLFVTINYGSMEKYYLSHFGEFYEWVGQQSNCFASYCQKEQPDSK
jgi:hypothetical protein